MCRCDGQTLIWTWILNLVGPPFQEQYCAELISDPAGWRACWARLAGEEGTVHSIQTQLMDSQMESGASLMVFYENLVLCIQGNQGGAPFLCHQTSFFHPCSNKAKPVCKLCIFWHLCRCKVKNSTNINDYQISSSMLNLPYTWYWPAKFHPCRIQELSFWC